MSKACSDTTQCTITELSSILAYLTGKFPSDYSSLAIMKRLGGKKVGQHYSISSDKVWEWIKPIYGMQLNLWHIPDIHILMHRAQDQVEEFERRSLLVVLR